jgi:hypothetical protein
MIRSKTAVAAAVFFLACASVPAFAQGGGNGGGNGGGGGGGNGGGHGAGVGAGMGHAGGVSASHMSAKGLADTNGHVAADRDMGQDRAADRASVHSQTHIGQHVNRGKRTATGHTATRT